MIKSEFAKTLPNKQILKVEMVQNFSVWKHYAIEIDFYKRDNKDQVP